MATRRQVLLTGALGAIAPGAFAQSRKTPRVGVLHPGSSKEPLAVQREPFERGLRELGWIPGSTAVIDYRYAEGDRSKLPVLAAELVRADVDVIVARSDYGINAARNATGKIPIVMAAYVGDPAADGIVKNMSRPGGNVTGIGNFLEIEGKRLEVLKDAFPSIRRVAVMSNPVVDGTQSAERVAKLRAAGRALKLEVQVFEVTRADQIAGTFSAIAKGRADALLVRGDPNVLDARHAEIVGYAAQRRLPAIYWFAFL